jgi:hypothetical protein
MPAIVRELKLDPTRKNAVEMLKRYHEIQKLHSLYEKEMGAINLFFKKFFEHNNITEFEDSGLIAKHELQLRRMFWISPRFAKVLADAGVKVYSTSGPIDKAVKANLINAEVAKKHVEVKVITQFSVRSTEEPKTVADELKEAAEEEEENE